MAPKDKTFQPQTRSQKLNKFLVMMKQCVNARKNSLKQKIHAFRRDRMCLNIYRRALNKMENICNDTMYDVESETNSFYTIEKICTSFNKEADQLEIDKYFNMDREEFVEYNQYHNYLTFAKLRNIINAQLKLVGNKIHIPNLIQEQNELDKILKLQLDIETFEDSFKRKYVKEKALRKDYFEFDTVTGFNECIAIWDAKLEPFMKN